MSKPEAGLLGARAKWGEDYAPKTLKLHGLSEPQRRLVLARVQGLRNASMRADESEAA